MACSMLGAAMEKHEMQPLPSGSSQGRRGQSGSGKAHWGAWGVQEDLGPSEQQAECVAFSGTCACHALADGGCICLCLPRMAGHS